MLCTYAGSLFKVQLRNLVIIIADGVENGDGRRASIAFPNIFDYVVYVSICILEIFYAVELRHYDIIEEHK